MTMTMSTSARSMIVLSLGLLLACGSTKEGNEDAGSAPECSAIDPSASERDCGTYVENHDLQCESVGGGEAGSDGATDEGGTDVGGDTGGGGGTGGGSDGTGGGGSDGGSSGGGEESTDDGLAEQCAELASANEAVVACILEADADGVAFGFGYETRNISIFTSSRYHVAADGTMWRTNDDSLDLCFYEATRVYGAVSFASCDSWDCIFDQVDNASLVATCEENANC